MASSAYYSNGEEEATAGPSGTGIETQQPSPCPPMTDASTIQGVDTTSGRDSDVSSTTRGIELMMTRHPVGHDMDGWANLAAKQNAVHNLCFFRRFGIESKRILGHLQGRAVNLFDQIRELDETSGTDLKSLSEGQKRKAGEEYKPGKRDILFDEAAALIERYYRLMFYDRKVQTLQSPLISEVTGLYEHLKDNSILDEEALTFMRKPEDFVSTRPAEDHAIWMFYTPWGWWLRKLLPRDGPARRWILRYKTLVLIERLALAVVTVVVLLGPLGVLFLVPMTKAESYWAVVSFVSAFATVMVLNKDPRAKFRDVMLVIFAYAAVLSSILVQMGYVG